jgi:predicted NAD/FAD-binding protein
MACAWSLTRQPEAFEVELWEALAVTGGVASTVAVGAEGVEINDQVQGGAPSYRNNILFFEEFGHRPHPVHLRVAFGTGALAWTNHSDSALVQRLLQHLRALQLMVPLLPMQYLPARPSHGDERLHCSLLLHAICCCACCCWG